MGNYKERNMNVRKGVVCLLLIALTAVTVFAGGKQEAGDETVIIQFASWMVAEESGGEVIIPQKIKEWESAHPGVTVEAVPLGWEDTPDKITLQTQGKNAPDIYTIESLWLGKFANMPGAASDLSSYMDSGFTSKLVPAYKGGEIGGKMAALVWNPNPWVLVVNKELAAKAGVSGEPKSFDDLIDQAEKISALSGDVFGLGLQLGVDEYAADTFHILMWALGGDMLDDQMQPAVNSAGTTRTFELVKDLVDKGVVPFGEEVRNLRTMFANGKIGFFFEGPWIAGVLDAEGMDRSEWTVYPFPGDVQPASHMLCLSDQSAHKDLAWDLMKFIVTDEDTTKEYYKGTGLMPVVASQYDDPTYDNHYSKVFVDQMSNLRNPNVWNSQMKFELEIKFMEAVQKVLLGQADVKGVLTDLEDEMKDILAE